MTSTIMDWLNINKKYFSNQIALPTNILVGIWILMWIFYNKKKTAIASAAIHTYLSSSSCTSIWTWQIHIYVWFDDDSNRYKLKDLIINNQEIVLIYHHQISTIRKISFVVKHGITLSIYHINYNYYTEIKWNFGLPSRTY